MKKFIKFFVVILIMAGIVYGGFYFLENKKEPEESISGDIEETPNNTVSSLDIVNEYMSQISTWGNTDFLEFGGGVYGQGYSFFDVDLDGEKELVVQIGGGTMANCKSLFYKMVDGTVQEVCKQNEEEGNLNLSILDLTKYKNSEDKYFYINKYTNKADPVTYVESWEKVIFNDGVYNPEYLFQKKYMYEEDGTETVEDPTFDSREAYFSQLEEVETNFEFILYTDWANMTNEEKIEKLLKAYDM